MTAPLHNVDETLIDTLLSLRNQIHKEAAEIQLQYMNSNTKASDDLSINNLLHYLAFRRYDLQDIQEDLINCGVSSLGLCEPHVLHTLDQVIATLQSSYIGGLRNLSSNSTAICRSESKKILKKNINNLLGHKNNNHSTRIMVTIPSEAAWNEQLITDLLNQGMDCARINCAHDDKSVWHNMINNIHSAQKRTGKNCSILMDLAGQKIRTVIKPKKQEMISIKPERVKNATIPAAILFHSKEITTIASEEADIEYQVLIPENIIEKAQVDDRFFFIDENGKKRAFYLNKSTSSSSWIGYCEKKTLLNINTTIQYQRKNQHDKYETLEEFQITSIPDQPTEYRVYPKDRIVLVYNNELSTQQSHTVQVESNHPEILKNLSPGHNVWFDDGKIGAVVERQEENCVILRVEHAKRNGSKLKTDKGINAPDTHIQLPCLTKKDLNDLDFICKYADMVGFSFVQSDNDMLQLIKELKKRNAEHLGIIAKIETKIAVNNLPSIILSAMGKHPLGVMIARGDLAIELGGVRLAEVQEELLWLCEAAHIPVIWATQVLESLTKNGITSRPEFTDAAMANRADCVMLNKGPYVVQAVETLNAILKRMEKHRNKKQSVLQALEW